MISKRYDGKKNGIGRYEERRSDEESEVIKK